MASQNVSIASNASWWSGTTTAAQSTEAPLSAVNSSTFVGAPDQVESSNDIEVAGIIAGVVFSVAGVILNVTAFTAVYGTHMRNRALRLGLLSLACSDLLLALSTMVILGLERQLKVAQQLIVGGSDRSVFCAREVFSWMWNAGSNCQLFTIALLAVQQFVAVRWPMHTVNGMSSRSSAYALAVSWLVSVLLGVAPAIATAARTEHHPYVGNWTQKGTTRFCYQVIIYYAESSTHPESYSYDVGSFELIVNLNDLDAAKMCAVLLVLAVSYGYVAYTMKQPCPGDGSYCSTADVACSGKRHQDRKRVLIVTATVTLLCLCSHLPLFINNSVCVADSSRRPCSNLMSHVLMTIVALSTVADPIIYMLRLQSVRLVAFSPLSRLRSSMIRS